MGCCLPSGSQIILLFATVGLTLRSSSLSGDRDLRAMWEPASGDNATNFARGHFFSRGFSQRALNILRKTRNGLGKRKTILAWLVLPKKKTLKDMVAHAKSMDI